MSMTLSKYSKLLAAGGTWCTVLTDAGAGTADSFEAADVRPGHIRDELLAAGAGSADARAVEEAVKPLEGVPSPVARFVIAHDGHVEVDEVMTGERVDSPYVNVGVIPDLLPLLRHSTADMPFVTVSVDRTGADITLAHAARPLGTAGTSTYTTQGITENLKKVPTGGWSQGQFQHRTEEVWRKNAEEVAAEIDRLVEAERPAVVAIGGDIRARELVFDQLSDASRAVAAQVESHTRAGGADPEVMHAAVERLLAEVEARSQYQLLDKLAEEKGHNRGRAAFGLGAVVQALQQAQVQTLVLSNELTRDPGAGNTAAGPGTRSAHNMLVLAASPWVALEKSEALGAEVLGQAPAASALIRAAVLTDADVELVPITAIPGRANAAALLRWNTGPAVPRER